MPSSKGIIISGNVFGNVYFFRKRFRLNDLPFNLNSAFPQILAKIRDEHI
jgi:hypothetical protein